MEKKFKRSDLKTGMLIEFKEGNKKIVLLGSENGDTTCAIGFHCVSGRLYDFYPLYNWDEDLRSTSHLGDIVKVYGMYGNLLWEREEPKPILTLDGVDYSEETLRSLIKKATS